MYFHDVVDGPGCGVVALVAIWSDGIFMNIVVAGVAISWCLRKDQRDMALSAGHAFVGANQGKTGRVVIEFWVFNQLPTFR